MSDEIPNQNVIRIYRSPADGQWRARIGPDDGRGVEQLGGTPCQALGWLIGHIHGGKYLFDPSWCPVEPGSVAGVNRCIEQGYALELGFLGLEYDCVLRCPAPDQLTGAKTGEYVPEPVDAVSARSVGKPGRPAQRPNLVELAARALGCDTGERPDARRAARRKAPRSR